MSPFFDAKVALVTGGMTGVGRNVARTFARVGAKVVVASDHRQDGEATVSMIAKEGGTADFIQTNVSRGAEVEAMVSRCLERHGRLDFAFNNTAAFGTPNVETTEYDERTWDQVVDLNLKGVWLAMKFEIPAMLRGGGGAIVNMSSTAGVKGGRGGVAFHASEHGVVGLTKAAAVEYGA
jgi:NAD(P)-dependent dehydrogenase (short-subunit alcohol dehydrogenase family)